MFFFHIYSEYYNIDGKKELEWEPQVEDGNEYRFSDGKLKWKSDDR